VAELIQRCILLSQHKLDMSKIRLQATIPTGLPAVHGDFNQLQQCLINLIFNAVDAMPDGGVLTLEVRSADAGRNVGIHLADSGPGIPPEHMAAIFEPFFTTKIEGHGLGLGLSTVYGIVERHQGTIEAANHSSGGAVFVITLPACP